MDILLDTNFIITCVKQKIDFDRQINEVTDEKVNWIIPDDVLKEIEDIRNRTGIRVLDKMAAETAMDLIRIIDFKKIELKGKNPNVDVKIANYLKGKNVVLATMDKGLKSRVKNRILTIRGKKGLEII